MVENRCSAAAGTLRPVMKCCSWLRIGWELVGSLLGPIFIACSCIHPPFYSPIGSFAKENKKSNAAFHISPQSLCLCPYWKSKQQKSRFKRFHLLYWKQKWGPVSFSLQQTRSSLVTLARWFFFLRRQIRQSLIWNYVKILTFSNSSRWNLRTWIACTIWNRKKHESFLNIKKWREGEREKRKYIWKQFRFLFNQMTGENGFSQIWISNWYLPQHNPRRHHITHRICWTLSD